MITLKNNIMNTLKHLRILALLVLLALCSTAQAQTGINYQGLARRASGAPVAEQNIKIKLSIRDVSASGTVVYTETRSTATNKFGLFNLVIGSTGAASQTGTLAGVNWATGAKFLQVEIDPDGGINFVDMGTTQLQAVPYALYANDVAKLQGKAVSTTAPTANQILKYNGTAWVPANEAAGSSITVGAVAATATPNAASITSGVLNLAPANDTNAGIVSTGSQSFAGNKNFVNNININGVNAGTPPGSQNTMFGTASFAYGTPGNDNVAVGFFTLASANGANNNTAVGSNALRQGGSASGNNNTALGFRTLSNGADGNNNVAVGSGAMDVADPGSNNTAVGFNATISGNSTNSTAIGSGASLSTNNTIQLGNTAITDVKTAGKLTTGAITYPNTDGASGQALVTNGTGTASWQTVGGASGAPIFKHAQVSQTSPTGTTESQIEVGGLVFRYNTQTNRIEVKQTTSQEPVWQAHNTSRIEGGVSQALQRPDIISVSSSAWTEFFDSWGTPPLTISGAYHSYEFELTPYLRGWSSDNHSFNIKVLCDGWNVVTLRVVYY
jgi:hypothetical protein